MRREQKGKELLLIMSLDELQVDKIIILRNNDRHVFLLQLLYDV